MHVGSMLPNAPVDIRVCASIRGVTTSTHAHNPILHTESCRGIVGVDNLARHLRTDSPHRVDYVLCSDCAYEEEGVGPLVEAWLALLEHWVCPLQHTAPAPPPARNYVCACARGVCVRGA
eukprot:TRINITY_DN2161_c0_g1_i3.p1 TRINITY_DN2161_c0_g1~~TRINITY_DN2161_c0_g1_i3.p1  ORF type:complete len:120 (-),score=2.49 TRINITY_DN2161_c0_g1_i3:68-427(-)